MSHLNMRNSRLKFKNLGKPPIVLKNLPLFDKEKLKDINMSLVGVRINLDLNS